MSETRKVIVNGEEFEVELEQDEADQWDHGLENFMCRECM